MVAFGFGLDFVRASPFEVLGLRCRSFFLAVDVDRGVFYVGLDLYSLRSFGEGDVEVLFLPQLFRRDGQLCSLFFVAFFLNVNLVFARSQLDLYRRGSHLFAV